MIVNLTPHTVNEVETNSKFQPSGKVARVSTQYIQQGDVDGIPLFVVKYGEVEGLPEPEEGTMYVVSSLVLEAMRGVRTDLIAPGELVRDEQGQPIGCKGFKK